MYSMQITTLASKNMPKVKKVTYKKFRLPWVKPVQSQQNLNVIFLTLNRFFSTEDERCPSNNFLIWSQVILPVIDTRYPMDTKLFIVRKITLEMAFAVTLFRWLWTYFSHWENTHKNATKNFIPRQIPVQSQKNNARAKAFGPFL